MLCGKKENLYKESFPSLPPRRCVSRHAAGEGVGGRVIKSTRRCCSSIGELSDHPCNLCLHARRLSLPRFSVTVAISFQFSKFGRGRTPRMKHFSLFVRSGRSPSPVVRATGRTRAGPDGLPIVHGGSVRLDGHWAGPEDVLRQAGRTVYLFLFLSRVFVEDITSNISSFIIFHSPRASDRQQEPLFRQDQC